MTTSSERACIRGCTIRGEHYASCGDFGTDIGQRCNGCAPRPARDRALICQRCYGRLRYHLDSAADLVGAIRARVDPLSARVLFDRTLVGGTLVDPTPAPMRVELVDASDDIVRALHEWAHYASTGVVAEHGFAPLPPGVESDEAYEIALAAASVILERDTFDRLANDSHQIDQMCSVFSTRHIPVGDPSWSIADALAEWPLEERAWFAAQRCPYCSLRTVKVTPPRTAHGIRTFSCEGCGWARTDDDTDGPWSLMFSRRSGQAA